MDTLDKRTFEVENLMIAIEKVKRKINPIITNAVKFGGREVFRIITPKFNFF